MLGARLAEALVGVRRRWTRANAPWAPGFSALPCCYRPCGTPHRGTRLTCRRVQSSSVFGLVSLGGWSGEDRAGCRLHHAYVPGGCAHLLPSAGAFQCTVPSTNRRWTTDPLPRNRGSLGDRYDGARDFRTTPAAGSSLPVLSSRSSGRRRTDRCCCQAERKKTRTSRA